MKQVLQVSILKRFMTHKELSEVIKKYDENRQHKGRGIIQPLTQKELKLYRDYMASNMSVREFGATLGMNENAATVLIRSLKLRIVKQMFSLEQLNELIRLQK